MRSAVYARKSQDDRDDRGKSDSIELQIADAKRYIEAQGWELGEIFQEDPGTSGGVPITMRPEGARLMAAISGPRRQIDCLVVSALDRLGRDQDDISYAVRKVTKTGVRLFSHRKGEILAKTATEKFMVSAQGYGAELEREQASERVFATAKDKFRNNLVPGGKLYGYANVREGDRKEVRQVVDPEQAKVVRRIFEMYGGERGAGVRAIARELNEDPGVPKRLQRRPDGPPRELPWTASGIRVMLGNETYRGLQRWNRSRRYISQDTGKRVKERKPEAQWMEAKREDLRIVTEEAWRAVQDRLLAQDARYLRSPEGQLDGSPRGLDDYSPYLLAGFLSCALCGGPVVIDSRAHGRPRPGQPRRRRHIYICSAHRDKGSCESKLATRFETMDHSVVTAICDALDRPELVAEVTELIDKTRTPEGRRNRAAEIEVELKKAGAAIAGLADLIGEIPADELKARLRRETARRENLDLERRELEQEAAEDSEAGIPYEGPGWIFPNLRKLFAPQGVVKGRQMLRRALQGPIKVSPDGRFSLTLKVAGLVLGGRNSSSQSSAV